MATSYTLNDSGLFPVLQRAFHEQTGITIQPSFVGTGSALAMARAGRADVVLVHERSMEDTFVNQGFGLNRRDVMYSNYVIVGPSSDPAKIRGATSAVDALSRIAAARAPFLSRGDDSGNHVRERSLWQLAEVTPSGPWYRVTHAGMFVTLRKASAEGAYTLTDRPSYLVGRKGLGLEILVAGDSRLRNAYGAMAVNPTKVPGVNYDAAIRFVDFLVSPTATAILRDFGREQFGEVLFYPMAGEE